MHEESNSKLIFHLCKINYDAYVTIKCLDTDVLIILLGNMHHIKNDLKISILLGTGNHERYINVNHLYETLGRNLCSSLPGFHAFTGCDCNPAFYRRGKKIPYKILKSSPAFIEAFTKIGQINDDNENTVRMLEKFVCRMYGFKSINDVNMARVATFTKAYEQNLRTSVVTFKNKIDGATFPPSKSELHQHILRTSYIAHFWSNAHLAVPTQFSPTTFGWEEKDDKYSFKWFDGDQLPPTIASITAAHDIPGIFC